MINGIFKNLPEPFTGMLYMLFGTIVLLDSTGAIHAGLLVSIGSLFFIGYGFILIQGPKRLATFFEKLQNKK